jgi:hypothetical protein
VKVAVNVVASYEMLPVTEPEPLLNVMVELVSVDASIARENVTVGAAAVETRADPFGV